MRNGHHRQIRALLEAWGYQDPTRTATTTTSTEDGALSATTTTSTEDGALSFRNGDVPLSLQWTRSLDVSGTGTGFDIGTSPRLDLGVPRHMMADVAVSDRKDDQPCVTRWSGGRSSHEWTATVHAPEAIVRGWFAHGFEKDPYHENERGIEEDESVFDDPHHAQDGDAETDSNNSDDTDTLFVSLELGCCHVTFHRIKDQDRERDHENQRVQPSATQILSDYALDEPTHPSGGTSKKTAASAVGIPPFFASTSTNLTIRLTISMDQVICDWPMDDSDPDHNSSSTSHHPNSAAGSLNWFVALQHLWTLNVFAPCLMASSAAAAGGLSFARVGSYPPAGVDWKVQCTSMEWRHLKTTTTTPNGITPNLTPIASPRCGDHGSADRHVFATAHVLERRGPCLATVQRWSLSFPPLSANRPIESNQAAPIAWTVSGQGLQWILTPCEPAWVLHLGSIDHAQIILQSSLSSYDTTKHHNTVSNRNSVVWDLAKPLVGTRIDLRQEQTQDMQQRNTSPIVRAVCQVLIPDVCSWQSNVEEDFDIVAYLSCFPSYFQRLVSSVLPLSASNHVPPFQVNVSMAALVLDVQYPSRQRNDFDDSTNASQEEKDETLIQLDNGAKRAASVESCAEKTSTTTYRILTTQNIHWQFEELGKSAGGLPHMPSLMVGIVVESVDILDWLWRGNQFSMKGLLRLRPACVPNAQSELLMPMSEDLPIAELHASTIELQEMAVSANPLAQRTWKSILAHLQQRFWFGMSTSSQFPFPQCQTSAVECYYDIQDNRRPISQLITSLSAKQSFEAYQGNQATTFSSFLFHFVARFVQYMTKLTIQVEKTHTAMTDAVAASVGRIAVMGKATAMASPVGLAVSIAAVGAKDGMQAASAAGKVARGATADDSYRFGDVTRGLTATIQRTASSQGQSSRIKLAPSDGESSGSLLVADDRDGANGGGNKFGDFSRGGVAPFQRGGQEDTITVDEKDYNTNPELADAKPKGSYFQKNKGRYAGLVGSSTGAMIGLAVAGPIGMIAGSFAGSFGAQSLVEDSGTKSGDDTGTADASQHQIPKSCPQVGMHRSEFIQRYPATSAVQHQQLPNQATTAHHQKSQDSPCESSQGSAPMDQYGMQLQLPSWQAHQPNQQGPLSERQTVDFPQVQQEPAIDLLSFDQYPHEQDQIGVMADQVVIGHHFQKWEPNSERSDTAITSFSSTLTMHDQPTEDVPHYAENSLLRNEQQQHLLHPETPVSQSRTVGRPQVQQQPDLHLLSLDQRPQERGHDWGAAIPVGTGKYPQVQWDGDHSDSAITSQSLRLDVPMPACAMPVQPNAHETAYTAVAISRSAQEHQAHEMWPQASCTLLHPPPAQHTLSQSSYPYSPQSGHSSRTANVLVGSHPYSANMLQGPSAQANLSNERQGGGYAIQTTQQATPQAMINQADDRNRAYRFGDLTRGVLAKGKKADGRDEKSGYQFGDFTRGLFSSSK